MVLFALDRAGRITLLEGRGLDAALGRVVGRSVFDLFAEVGWIVDANRRALAGAQPDAQRPLGPRHRTGRRLLRDHAAGGDFRIGPARLVDLE